MKRKQWTALALSAILSFSACIPVTGIGVYAAENDVTQETVFEEAAESAFEETAEDSVFSGEDTGGDALSDPAADPFAAENAEAETPQAFDDAAEGAVESPEEAAVNASEPAGGEGAAPEAGNSFEEADPFEAEAGAEGAEYDTAADPAATEGTEFDTAADPAATEGTKFDAAADPAGAGGTEFEIPAEEPDDDFGEISSPADTAGSESTEFDAAAAPASDPFAETPSDPADAAAGEEQTFLTEDGQEEAVSEKGQNSSIEPTEENFASAADIAAGDVLDVNITREAPAFFRFIPAETGGYKIYSTNETNCDPGLILYDESGCNIGSADDENGSDFSYKAVFNEESVYYLQAYCYGSEAVYQIHLEKLAFFVEHGETERLISPGEEVTLEVNAVSSSPLSYQWYLNDVPVEGETSSTFTFTPESHCYASCSVSDEDGNSENVNYEIFFETGLTASAAGDSTFSLDPGSSQTLAVEASANEGIELSYRWFNRTTEEYIESDSGDPARCTIENLQSYTEIICYVSDPYGNELSIDFTLHVELDPIDISGAEVTVAADGLTYDGKAKTPAVTVKYDGKALTAGTDYDVTYTGNISAGTNTAKATVTGKGKYKGTVEKTFSIAKAAQDLKAGNLSIAFSASKKLTVTGAQGTVTYESRAPAVAAVAADGTVTGRTIGSAKITVSAAGNANYLPAHAEITITVTAAKLTAGHVTVDAEGLVYNGKDQTPAVTVKYGSTVLTAGTDYDLTYKNNKDAGTDTAKAIVTGKSNYTGTAEKTFSIAKAAHMITAKAAKTTLSATQKTTIKVTGARGAVTYKSNKTTVATVDANGNVTAKAVGTATITVTDAGNANYNKAAAVKVIIKVTPKATTKLTAASQARGIKLTWAKVAGAKSYIIYRNNKNVKTITSGSTVTWTDTGANTNGTEYTFKVVAKAATGTSALSKSLVTYHVARPAISSAANTAAKKMTVKWKKNDKASGYEIQYTLKSSFSGAKSVKITKAATVSKVIGGLKKGKTYYIRIRTYKTVGKAKYRSAWSGSKKLKITK